MEQSVISGDIGYEIRELREDELEFFLRTMRQNYFSWENEEEIKNTFASSPEEFLIAVSIEGKLFGVSCALSRRGSRGFVGLSLVVDCENFPDVEQSLIKEACDRLPDRVIDMVLPVANVPEISSPHFKKQCKIYLYTADAKDIKLFNIFEKVLSSVTPIDITKPYQYKIRILSKNEENKFVNVKGPLTQTEAGYVLTLADNINGYAVLRKCAGDKWILGPVIAFNQFPGVYLLKVLLRYIQEKKLTGTVLAYIIEDNEMANCFLSKAGFVKAPQEWNRYSLHHSMLPGGIRVEDVHKNVFSLGSLSSDLI